MRQSNLLALSQVVFIPICTQKSCKSLHKYKILMHINAGLQTYMCIYVCIFTHLHVHNSCTHFV